MEDAGLTCGAVCVYPNRVAECVEALKRSNPKRHVQNWKHRFDPGTRRKTSQWLQWRLVFQVAKCLFPQGFRWLKLLQLDFVHHLFLSALFFLAEIALTCRRSKWLLPTEQRRSTLSSTGVFTIAWIGELRIEN